MAYLTYEVRDLNDNLIASCTNRAAILCFIRFAEHYAVPRGAFVVWEVNPEGFEEVFDA